MRGMMGTWGIRLETRGIKVGIRRIGVGIRRTGVGKWGIRVVLRGNLRVYCFG